MKIEMTENEMLKVFGNLGKVETFKNPIDLNGHKFMLANYYSYPSLHQEFEGRCVNLEMVRLVDIKSPQEIAAEEAVQSSKESLKAAEAVLKQLKEK